MIVFSGVFVEGLALDASAGNLYFTKRNAGIVGIIKLGENYIKTLIKSDVKHPGDIVIDLRAG